MSDAKRKPQEQQQHIHPSDPFLDCNMLPIRACAYTVRMCVVFFAWICLFPCAWAEDGTESMGGCAASFRSEKKAVLLNFFAWEERHERIVYVFM